MDPFTLAVKAHHVHFTNSFSTESSISKHRLTKSLGIPKPSPPLTFLTRISGFRHFNSIDLLRNSGSKVVEGLRFDGPVMDVDEIIDCEEGDLVVETCITRTLPPALTLEHGLESISEAVNKLKTDPPSSSSGVLRFQVQLIMIYFLPCMVVSVFVDCIVLWYYLISIFIFLMGLEIKVVRGFGSVNIFFNHYHLIRLKL